ncbi:MAG TPA: hypothetical protein VGN78_00910 [Solirubrobacteraceae bacterium]|jgi:hypothetical protein|nr:hypothetical protein [Solirubrobacteraceae bacterium]
MEPSEATSRELAPTQHGKFVSYDLDEARAKFGTAPFRVSHELSDHPLFTNEALAELADSLPPEKVEHNLGTVGAVVPDGEVPQLDLSPGEIVRGIQDNGCWIVLPELQKAPGYKEIYDAILDDVAPLVDGGRASMSGYHSVIFMAAPGSTTPTHIDPELGFLLHLRGDKRISVGRFPDEETGNRELEAFHHGGHRNTQDLPVEAEHFDLAPNQGVHVPPHTPHWVENGESVAVSLSVGFRTPENLRRAGVYMWNARVRRLGLSPRPPGDNTTVDRVKSGVIWSTVNARRRVLRRSD